jgi:hypothetical protein
MFQLSDIVDFPTSEFAGIWKLDNHEKELSDLLNIYHAKNICP